MRVAYLAANLPSNPQDPRAHSPHMSLVFGKGGVSFLFTALQPHHLLFQTSAHLRFLHLISHPSPTHPKSLHSTLPTNNIARSHISSRLSARTVYQKSLAITESPSCRADLGRRGNLYNFREWPTTCRRTSSTTLIHLVYQHVRDPA